LADLLLAVEEAVGHRERAGCGLAAAFGTDVANRGCAPDPQAQARRVLALEVVGATQRRAQVAHILQPLRAGAALVLDHAQAIRQERLLGARGGEPFLLGLVAAGHCQHRDRQQRHACAHAQEAAPVHSNDPWSIQRRMTLSWLPSRAFSLAASERLRVEESDTSPTGSFQLAGVSRAWTCRPSAHSS